jgi:predicted regulator of Ras-like GTPase activity (Roadblock/LC7/MglB family)
VSNDAAQTLLSSLQSLRDVDGVLGSFVWRPDGVIFASDVPAHVPLETLEAVVSRIQRLHDSFTSVGELFESTTLVFAQYKLHLCVLEHAFLGIVLASFVNMSALKMALSLTQREFAGMLAQMTFEPAPATSQRSSGRYYRGRRVAD